MSNDRELLEWAAKAAVIQIDKSDTNGGGRGNDGFDLSGNAVLDWHNYVTWNPLTDNGDALRLVVKLKIPLQFPDWKNITRTWGSKSNPDAFDEPHNDDPYAATRRAIVSAAAEIGKAMP